MGVTLHTYAHGELNWDTKLVPVPGSGGDSDLERIAAAINTATAADGTDFNTITQSGIYLGGTVANAPGGSTNSFFVWANRFNATNQAQIAVNLSTGVMWVRKQQSGTWLAWDQVATASTIQGLIGDTGWVTSSTGITAASGWTLNSSKYRIRNGLAEVGVNVTKNATAVTAGSNGSIANTPLVNLPALLVPTSANGMVTNVGATSTFSAQGYFSQSASQIVLTMASGGIPASGVFDGYGFCYL